MIGDGTELPITRTSSTALPSPSKSFVLNDVLSVPSIKKKKKENLLSVFKLCTSNYVSIEFLSSSFGTITYSIS